MVNMAQNMYKWGCIAKRNGANASLFLHPLDSTAISSPEWEEFESEYKDIFDKEGFLKNNPAVKTEIPCHTPLMDGSELLNAYNSFAGGKRKPLLHLMSNYPGMRHEVFFDYDGFYPYFRWAQELSSFDVIYAASSPFGAYASGRPYCVFSVGGDLQNDCGRADSLGRAMSISFNSARFLFASNPHTLGHCRRLGFSNAVYLPYPMDDGKYCPGDGIARKEWDRKYGKGVYILTTSRLDKNVKGYSDDYWELLKKAAKEIPELRLIFLDWGHGSEEFRKKIELSGMQKNFIMLSPVGKKKLIDYYRSCDIVIDHFVYGYYGATALEAASIGKPVIMKLRSMHYSPLYDGDIMPALNVSSPDEVYKALTTLATSENLRTKKGKEMRQWLVNTHGEKKTAPLMLAMLRVAADQTRLPGDLINPLLDDESAEEKAYHASCLREST
jgi:glycosyltransferase involved in cell wall biosynthesis